MRKWCVGVIAMAMLVSVAFAACPNKCSGHGRCGKNDVCDCMQNWVGGDCGGRLCPFTRAWHDTAEGDDDAHYYAECGNRGFCDREKGVCECDEPFAGSGCRRMACPADCSGHGSCDFIEELAAAQYDKRVGGVFGRKYTLWDQEKIMGCRCDPGFEGHNCAKRVCPKGDDPLTTGQNEMVQAINIGTTLAEGFLTYHDPYGNAWTTERIEFGTFAAQATVGCVKIEEALRRLPNNVLSTVKVTDAITYDKFVRDSPTADTGTVTAGVAGGATTAIICLVTFQPEPGSTGYQNLLDCDVTNHDEVGQHPVTTNAVAATCIVEEVSSTATRVLSELAECSNRGQCDGATGMCKCYTGHMGLACQKQEALV